MLLTTAASLGYAVKKTRQSNLATKILKTINENPATPPATEQVASPTLQKELEKLI